MNLRSLSIAQMFKITGELTQSPDCQQVLAKYSILAPHATMLDRAHRGIVPLALKSDQKLSDALENIVETEIDVDARHDHSARAGHTLVTLAAMVVVQPETAFEMDQLLDTLYPEGSGLTSLSYMAEAGAAQDLEKKLTPQLRAQTDAIAVSVGKERVTLSQLLDQQIELGKRLGKLEVKRRQLEQVAAEDQHEQTSEQRVNHVRTTWVKIVQLFVHTVSSVDEISEIDRTLLLQPIEKELRTTRTPQ